MGHAEPFQRMSTWGQWRRNLREEHGFSLQSIDSTGRVGETLFLKTVPVNFTSIHLWSTYYVPGSVPSVCNG